MEVWSGGSDSWGMLFPANIPVSQGGSTQRVSVQEGPVSRVHASRVTLLPEGLPLGPPGACVLSVPPLDCKHPEGWVPALPGHPWVCTWHKAVISEE